MLSWSDLGLPRGLSLLGGGPRLAPAGVPLCNALPVCSEVEMLTVYPTSRFGTYLTSYNSQAKAKSKWNFVPQTAESKLEFCNASIEERSSQWRPIRSSSI